MLELVLESPILRLLLLVLLFAMVAAGVYLVAHAIGARQLARSRLFEAAPAGGAGAATIGSLRAERVESAWLKLVNSIEKGGLSLVDTKDAALRQKMIAAGYPQPFAPRVYTLVRLVLVIALPLLVLLYLWRTGSSPSMVKLYFSLVIAASLGLYLPNIFIRAKADRRQRALINAFPDALDLMLVCVEAGLGLEAAFSRVGMEMTTSHPLLAEQFGAVVLELRAGRSHEDVWPTDHSFSDRRIELARTTSVRSQHCSSSPRSSARPSRRPCGPTRRKCAKSAACVRRRRRIACRC